MADEIEDQVGHGAAPTVWTYARSVCGLKHKEQWIGELQDEERQAEKASVCSSNRWPSSEWKARWSRE